jgi:hypothetical protein
LISIIRLKSLSSLLSLSTGVRAIKDGYINCNMIKSVGFMMNEKMDGQTFYDTLLSRRMLT